MLVTALFATSLRESWRGIQSLTRISLLELTIVARNFPIHYSLHTESARRRHPGSVEWFLGSDAYQTWVNIPHGSDPGRPAAASRTLFCPGAPGAGKTIVASAVIADLKSRFPSTASSTVDIVYLYCDLGADPLFSPNREFVKPEASRSWRPNRLDADSKRGFRVPATRITDDLGREIQKRVFVIIDALDECDRGRRRIMLKELFKLQKLRPIHLLVTSNHDPHIAGLFSKADLLEIRANKEDMRSYLEYHISHLLPFIGDDYALEAEIVSSVINAADGR